MSQWTHVAAIFRVDSFRFAGEKLNFTEIFGKELGYDDLDAWYEADVCPEKFLPFGSEGSLHMSVWENPKVNHLAAYTVSVFGDLRDYSDIEKIMNWFDEKCKLVRIRQAVITVDNGNEVETKTYVDEEEVP